MGGTVEIPDAQCEASGNIVTSQIHMWFLRSFRRMILPSLWCLLHLRHHSRLHLLHHRPVLHRHLLALACSQMCSMTLTRMVTLCWMAIPALWLIRQPVRSSAMRLMDASASPTARAWDTAG